MYDEDAAGSPAPAETDPETDPAAAPQPPEPALPEEDEKDKEDEEDAAVAAETVEPLLNLDDFLTVIDARAHCKVDTAVVAAAFGAWLRRRPARARGTYPLATWHEHFQQMLAYTPRVT